MNILWKTGMNFHFFIGNHLGDHLTSSLSSDIFTFIWHLHFHLTSSLSSDIFTFIWHLYFHLTSLSISNFISLSFVFYVLSCAVSLQPRSASIYCICRKFQNNYGEELFQPNYEKEVPFNFWRGWRLKAQLHSHHEAKHLNPESRRDQQQLQRCNACKAPWAPSASINIIGLRLTNLVSKSSLTSKACVKAFDVSCSHFLCVEIVSTVRCVNV